MCTRLYVYNNMYKKIVEIVKAIFWENAYVVLYYSVHYF